MMMETARSGKQLRMDPVRYRVLGDLLQADDIRLQMLQARGQQHASTIKGMIDVPEVQGENLDT